MKTKTLITDQTVNQIHITEVSEMDTILVRKKGKIVATIAGTEDLWFCIFTGCSYTTNQNLSSLINHERLIDCEFDVIVNEF